MTWVTEPTNYPYYGLITISYGSFDYLHHTRTDPDDRLYQEKRALPDFEEAWLRERRTIFRRPGKGANTPYRDHESGAKNEKWRQTRLITHHQRMMSNNKRSTESRREEQTY